MSSFTQLQIYKLCFAAIILLQLYLHCFTNKVTHGMSRQNVISVSHHRFFGSGDIMKDSIPAVDLIVGQVNIMIWHHD